jgi:tetratricopeptide (TPR) repeat protein
VLGACGAPAPRGEVRRAPTALELYEEGRFDEALRKADAALRARIHFSAHGPSLGDPRAAIRLLTGLAGQELELAEAWLAVDAARARALVEGRREPRARLIRGEISPDLMTDDLALLNALGRAAFRKGDRELAAGCVDKALPLARRRIAAARVPLTDLHQVAETDELYADLLRGNRHTGHARGLYAKNRTRFRLWPHRNVYVERRLRETEEKIRATDGELFGKQSR